MIMKAEIEKYLKSMNFTPEVSDNEVYWSLKVLGGESSLDYCVYLDSNSLIVYDISTDEDIFLEEYNSPEELLESIKKLPSFKKYEMTPKVDTEQVWVSENENMDAYATLFLIKEIDCVKVSD